MQSMQLSSLTMHDTEMYEAELDLKEKNWPGISPKIIDRLISKISTGISLPILSSCNMNTEIFEINILSFKI